MKNLLHITSKFFTFSESNVDEKLDAVYPSEQWSATSWTFWLLNDYIHGYSVYRKLIKLNPIFRNFVFNILYKNKLDAYSNHFDFSSKIYLYKLLCQVENKSKILLPESGPAGLEVLMAKAAGFEQIVTFDSNPQYVSCFKNIWPNISCLLIRTSDFAFSEYIDAGFMILIPYWGHDGIDNLSVPLAQKIVCFEKGNFNHHLKKIHSEDLINFYAALDKLELLKG